MSKQSLSDDDRKLILRDLSARLPYGVNGLITVHITTNKDSSFGDIINGKYYDRFANPQESWYDNIPCIKPYLRSMSSMTEEEKIELNNTMFFNGLTYNNTADTYDWLNRKMFDHRGLIPKGLALEALEEMYKFD